MQALGLLFQRVLTTTVLFTVACAHDVEVVHVPATIEVLSQPPPPAGRGARRVAMAASYYPPRPQPELRARVEAVEAYLAEQHVSTISWHYMLNNHASTRPKVLGGPLVRAVTDWTEYTRVAPGSASAPWRCLLNLANSFTPNDGIRLQTEGYGSTPKRSV